MGSGSVGERQNEKLLRPIHMDDTIKKACPLPKPIRAGLLERKNNTLSERIHLSQGRVISPLAELSAGYAGGSCWNRTKRVCGAGGSDGENKNACPNFFGRRASVRREQKTGRDKMEKRAWEAWIGKGRQAWSERSGDVFRV